MISKSVEIQGFKGEIEQSRLAQNLYSTDASIYRMQPRFIAFPKDTEDIQLVVNFAIENKLGITARGGGTSLAGQCVGKGIIMDCSRHMNKILAIDPTLKTATVQPGVVRDQLNLATKKHGLWFGPNTSTSNRCTIGGMAANNSSGSTSIRYGVTREKILASTVTLSDGTIQKLERLTIDEWADKLNENTLLGTICKGIDQLLTNANHVKEIEDKFPNKNIHRRNSGYALDKLIDFRKFGGTSESINLNYLLSGSEGTLGIFSEITIQLEDLPPPHHNLQLLSFKSLEEALDAVPKLLTQDIYTCELMDDAILTCAKKAKGMEQALALIDGTPVALLMIELRGNTADELKVIENTFNVFCQSNFNANITQIIPPNDQLIWDLRKAGLGIMSNVPGNKAAIACVEDTAVHPEDLRDYILDFKKIVKTHDQEPIYYAHAGAGELHIRPILNLKDSEQRRLFKQLCLESMRLVKKYKGSLSGEHGDGIVRGYFLKEFYGEIIYSMFKSIKELWDPEYLFNPGKIINVPDITEHLRTEDLSSIKVPDTFFDWVPDENILQHIERCNGSGDCIKDPVFGSYMCPTYHAERKEEFTTRGRANVLREAIRSKGSDAFSSPEVKTVMETCVSCKACTTECPSGVNMSKLKAVFLHHNKPKYSVRNIIFTKPKLVYKLLTRLPFSTYLTNGFLGKVFKNLIGVHPKRQIKIPNKNTLFQHIHSLPQIANGKTIYLLIDEFSNYLDGDSSTDIVTLLRKLNYSIKPILYHSARGFISKGFLDQAKKEIINSINTIDQAWDYSAPLVGLEPSAALGLKDEFKEIGLTSEQKSKLDRISDSLQLFDQFLIDEINQESIHLKFKNNTQKVHLLFHGHCHQKSISGVETNLQLLNLIPNSSVELIRSSCCGMAGSFGYEKENYSLSKKMAFVNLIPQIEKSTESIVVATGISCRDQIDHFSSIQAIHPATVMLRFLA